MIPVAIFAFLVGAVLAWGFRVWILIPTTLLTIATLMIFGLSIGAGFLTAVASSLLVGLAPQLGYAFSLMTRSALVFLRSPRKSHVAILGKHQSIEGA
jgi:hypothetical protein